MRTAPAPRTRRRSGSRSRTTVLAGVLLGVLALTGCSGSGSQDTVQSEGAAQAVTPEQPDKVFGAAETGRAAAGGSAVGKVASVDQRLVRTATLDLRTRDVPAAAARVRSLATAAGGFVADERTDTGQPRPADDESTARSRSVLTLRIPTASLDKVMQQVTQVGTVLHRSQSSEDVSAQYVDTASRVRSQTASVIRVRALLSRATRIGDVVQIEGELARRQSDLEALQAQLASLQNRTSLSTLTVSVSSSTVSEDDSPDTGLLAGLHAGWTALRVSAVALLTVLGALLPFAALAALIVVPTVRWRRRRARRSPAQPTHPAQPTQPAS